MKRLSVLVLCVLLGSTLYAQNVKYGVTGGLNMSTLTKATGAELVEEDGDQTYGNKMKPGFHVGVFAEAPLAGSGMISIRPELHYTQLGSKYESDNGNVEAKQNFDAIELPVLFKFGVAPGLSIMAGPSVSYLMGGKVDYSGESVLGTIEGEYDLDMDNYNRTNLDVVAGLGFDIDRLNIYGKYGLGLTDMTKADDFEAFNSTIQIGLGYSF